MKIVRLLPCFCLMALAVTILTGCSGEKPAAPAKLTAQQDNNPNTDQVIKDAKPSPAGAEYIKTHMSPGSGR